MMRPAPGLPASPLVGYNLGVAKRGCSPPAGPLWTDEPLRCGGPLRTAGRGPGKIPVGLRTQPPNERFFTLFSEAGSNIVESVAIPLRHAPAPRSSPREQIGHRARRRPRADLRMAAAQHAKQFARAPLRACACRLSTSNVVMRSAVRCGQCFGARL